MCIQPYLYQLTPSFVELLTGVPQVTESLFRGKQISLRFMSLLVTHRQHSIHRSRYIFNIELPAWEFRASGEYLLWHELQRKIGRHRWQVKRYRFRSESTGSESGNKIWSMPYLSRRHGCQVFGVFKKCFGWCHKNKFNKMSVLLAVGFVRLYIKSCRYWAHLSPASRPSTVVSTLEDFTSCSKTLETRCSCLQCPSSLRTRSCLLANTSPAPTLITYCLSLKWIDEGNAGQERK